jgi:flagellar basal body-associated protein FliL
MADEKKKDAKDAGDSAPADPKVETKKSDSGGNKMLFLILIVVVLVINTGVAFFIVQMTMPKKEPVVEAKNKVDTAKAEAEHESAVTATTAEKPIEALVNIAGTDGERFLKVAVAFEYDDVAHPLLAEALEARAPKIKDMMIDHLSKLTLVEVTEPEAKDKIRKDLLRLVNNSIPNDEGSIRDVYIVNFIIQ